MPVYLGGSKVTNTDPVRQNCTNFATLNFLLQLGMEWNGGIIKCSAVNDNYPSDNETTISDTDTLDIIQSKEFFMCVR